MIIWPILDSWSWYVSWNRKLIFGKSLLDAPSLCNLFKHHILVISAACIILSSSITSPSGKKLPLHYPWSPAIMQLCSAQTHLARTLMIYSKIKSNSLFLVCQWHWVLQNSSVWKNLIQYLINFLLLSYSWRLTNMLSKIKAKEN